MTFLNWTIQNDGESIGRQYDNLTTEIVFEGQVPTGWEFDLLLQNGGKLNIITLERTENGLLTILQSSALALSGWYTVQLRGRNGYKIRHTNKIMVFVPDSISGDITWPTIPEEFTQLEQRVRQLSEDAAGSAAKAQEAAAESTEQSQIIAEVSQNILEQRSTESAFQLWNTEV